MKNTIALGLLIFCCTSGAQSYSDEQAARLRSQQRAEVRNQNLLAAVKVFSESRSETLGSHPWCETEASRDSISPLALPLYFPFPLLTRPPRVRDTEDYDNIAYRRCDFSTGSGATCRAYYDAFIRNGSFGGLAVRIDCVEQGRSLSYGIGNGGRVVAWSNSRNSENQRTTRAGGRYNRTTTSAEQSALCELARQRGEGTLYPVSSECRGYLNDEISRRR